MNNVDFRNDRIFVSIANYRDPEIFETIKDILAKAKFPDRIKIGVLTQIDFEKDDPRVMVHGSSSNVRELVFDARESKGCCWARSKILTEMRKDEEFVLQTDAHCRFIQDWDIGILEEYSRLPHPNCVLTSYPLSYLPGEPLDPNPKHVYIKFKDTHSSGLPLFCADASFSAANYEEPQPTVGLSAACLFGRSNIFDKVPYDPYIYFFGEEIDMAVRLYTHGFDLYCPKRMFIYHLYLSDKVKRNHHWQDHNENAEMENMIKSTNIERVKFKFGISKGLRPANAVDLHKYWLGKERTIEQWQAAAGVNLEEALYSDKALQGKYSEPNIYSK